MRPCTAISHLAADHQQAFQQISVLRPFLALQKADLQTYCETAGVAWIDDPSNRDLSFARVRNRFLLAGARHAFMNEPLRGLE